jgi:hypothetical protein
LKKNITSSNSNKLLFKNNLNYNNVNSNINDIDYYNYDSINEINNYKYNNSESNIPLNKIIINKKPIKLNLYQDLPNNKIHILQNNNYNYNNTINITIDNSVNNIYNNNTKITYIKDKNDNNNSKN